MSTFYSAPVGPVAAGSGGLTITQTAPFTGAALLGNAVSYSVTLQSTGGRGGIAWSQSTGSADLSVSIYGVVTTTGALPVGSYTATGTMADAYSASGTWMFTLTVGGGYTLPDGGINIAFSSDAFSSTPAWVRVDTPGGTAAPVGVSAWTVDRGRASMLDTTQTGTASITILDSEGVYDPSNPSSPLYGGGGPYSSEIGPMRAVNIQLFNPVNTQWYSIFTGYTESWTYSFPATPSNVMMQAVVACSDGFEPLSRAELVPDSSNSTTFSGVQGLNAVKLRMLAVLAQFQTFMGGLNAFPTDPNAIFSGNINILSAVYTPHTSLLSALQDAADAEFPGVANLFMDKFGNVAFRGRVPRFLPQNYTRNGTSGLADISLPPTVSLPIQFWGVGDAAAAATYTTAPTGPLAPINDIGWLLDNAAVINVCQCYPGGEYDTTASISGNTSTNPASVTQYGARLLAIPDLYTGGSVGVTTGNPYLEPAGLTPLQLTKLYGDAYVNNLGYPAPRITTLKFVTQEDATIPGNALWHFVTGVEIGDVVNVYTTDPGGGGFNADQFFVEGLHYQVAPGARYPQVTLTVDVSPRQWFSYFNGFYFYSPDPIFFSNSTGFVNDGNPTNGSSVFNAATNKPFVNTDVGRTIVVLDQSTNTPYQLTITGFTSASTVTISQVSPTVSATFTGPTLTNAPYQIVTLFG